MPIINPRWCLLPPKNKPKNCILFLPGRDQHAIALIRPWLNFVMKDTLLVGVTPTEQYWYPSPNSPCDQEDAVKGLEAARIEIESCLEKIEEGYGIPRDKIVLSGFSAGAVMSIYVATRGERALGGVMAFSGAILEPENLPECKFKAMLMTLSHSQDDPVFSWEGRYLPMRRALTEKHYAISTYESESDQHNTTTDQIVYSATTMAKHMNWDLSYTKQPSVFGPGA